MALHTVIEHLLNALVNEGYRAFNIKPKKDHEGFIVLKYPFTYYAISILLAIMTGVFAYLLYIHPGQSDFWVGVGVTLLFAVMSYLALIYIKNTHYRFNDREIIHRNLFKREQVIFWSDCSVKPMNPLSQQITLYTVGAKFKISHKYIGFNILVDLIGPKFNKSQAELGVKGFV